MKSGYEIVWSDQASDELTKTLEYLEQNFTEKELKRLSREIEKNLNLISENPLIFSGTDIRNVRKVIIARYNTLYYRIKGKNIEIISFFSNRQNPAKRKI
ncbi:MAG: type II toxin-antitoxin system RelE/ParE family toxin [Weeksellaceae bacterium]|nr:type II toxin-antitoxin system RelE/ParE family toxin [Bacteroidota bacterium]MCG2779962.1 type II toxin-antitoxin system RelE/ParE family toxin [Weeksellaceae bacterium]